MPPRPFTLVLVLLNNDTEKVKVRFDWRITWIRFGGQRSRPLNWCASQHLDGYSTMQRVSYLLERVGQSLVAVQVVVQDVCENGTRTRSSADVSPPLASRVLLQQLLTSTDDALRLAHEELVWGHAEIARTLKSTTRQNKNKVDVNPGPTSSSRLTKTEQMKMDKLLL